MMDRECFFNILIGTGLGFLLGGSLSALLISSWALRRLREVQRILEKMRSQLA